MNEHIKRLSLLCGAWIQVYPNQFGQKLTMVDSNFDYEKFAELMKKLVRHENHSIL